MILGQSKFYQNFLNSVLVSLTTIIIAAAVSSAMAFVPAIFPSKQTRIIFGFIILTIFIPGTTMIVPQFELAAKLQFINKFEGLIPFYVGPVIDPGRCDLHFVPEIFCKRTDSRQCQRLISQIVFEYLKKGASLDFETPSDFYRILSGKTIRQDLR